VHRHLPGNVSTAIDLREPLRRAGRAEEADALAGRIRAFHETLLQKYPNCTSAHNSVAWLLARCRIDLDAALRHAQQAADLEPDNCAILDTLAEVYFQRGQKKEAVAAIRRCAELQPHVQRHRQALKRFLESTPDSPPPPE